MNKYDGWHLAIIEEKILEVTPCEESRIDLKTKLKFCERYAKEQQLALQFKLYSNRELDGLEKILKIQHYAVVQSQLLMARKDMAVSLMRNPCVSIKLYEAHDEAFKKHRKALSLEKIEIGDRACFCELFYEDISVGIAYATIKSGKMGIFNVAVEADYRHRGFGEQIIRVLFHWGRENDATTAYLQVASDNTIAVHLYKKLGFHEEAKSWIRKKI